MKISKSSIFFFPIMPLAFFFLSCMNLGIHKSDNRKVKKEAGEAKIKRLHVKAQRLIDQSDFDKAEAILDSILTIKPDAIAYFKLGLISSKSRF